MIGRMKSLPKRTPLLITLFFFAVSAQAAVHYTVKKGDTLSGIAKKFGISVKEIRHANEVNARKMRPGAKIVIPVHEASKKRAKKTARHEAAAGKVIAAEEKKAEEKTEEPSGALYHTVKKGETLRLIARRYSVSVAELKELNHLRSSRIKKGKKLIVARTEPGTYTVREGDTVETIAKKFDMEADQLMELNELESPELKQGQKLYVEGKVDTIRAEAYRERAEKLEEDLRKTEASEEFQNEDKKEKLITFAKKLLDIPYKFGGNSILGIDCSAYVKKVYGLLGIDLPRTAREQFNEGGEAVDKDHLSMGDLVFFRTYASFPSHVGIYLGDNLFIHASSKGRKVTINSLETPYYLKRFIGGKRLLTTDGQDTDQKD
jgi:peptidoglycan endopeptidase LytE